MFLLDNISIVKKTFKAVVQHFGRYAYSFSCRELNEKFDVWKHHQQPR